jgi:hypothetical protein
MHGNGIAEEQNRRFSSRAKGKAVSRSTGSPKMGNTGFYILAGIFGLVIVGMIGLATFGAPKYTTGDPRITVEGNRR